jgi:Helix-turn-helix domain of resolvase
VRKYKRKRPSGWPDKNRRMVLAVRLRAEGKSLRQIARELAVGVATVHRDLARWDELSNVVSLFQPGVPARPQRGNLERLSGTPRTTAEAMGIPQGPMTVRQEWEFRAVEVLNDWR